MSKKRIFIALVVLVLTMFGYTFARTLDVSDNYATFAEFISDIQEVFAYDDTTLMSVTGINQRNFQAADDEWEEIYNYADEVQGK
jgi:endonuclease IV